jgi:uncharacterized membrane protein
MLPLGLDRFTFEKPSLIELHMASAHFPIALLLTSVACEAIGAVWKKAAGLRTTAFWTHILGTISATLTVALGWFGNPTRGQHNEFAQQVTVHQWWGIAALVIFALLALWRIKRGAKRTPAETLAYALISLLGVAVVSITGYLGAHLGG